MDAEFEDLEEETGILSAGCFYGSESIRKKWEESRDRLFSAIRRGPLVPIFRDALMAWLICELARFPRHGEEVLEGLFVQVSFGILVGMIGHHGGWEGVASRGDKDSSEWGEEEIRVRVNGVVEAGLAEGEESAVLLRGGLLKQSVKGLVHAM